MKPNIPTTTPNDRRDGAASALWLLVGVALLAMASLFFTLPSPAAHTGATEAVTVNGSFGSSGEVPHTGPYVTFDHSVVNERSTPAGSDEPGASIAAYGP